MIILYEELKCWEKYFLSATVSAINHTCATVELQPAFCHELRRLTAWCMTLFWYIFLLVFLEKRISLLLCFKVFCPNSKCYCHRFLQLKQFSNIRCLNEGRKSKGIIKYPLPPSPLWSLKLTAIIQTFPISQFLITIVGCIQVQREAITAPGPSLILHFHCLKKHPLPRELLHWDCLFVFHLYKTVPQRKN